MADDTPARRFAQALQTFESKGDKSELTGMFTNAAELFRPEVRKRGASTDDPDAYWDAYASQFSEIHTEFTNVRQDHSVAWLEWRSTGRLSTGRAIEYAGVSLLELDGGRVRRFATYYDTAAFLEPEGHTSTPEG